MKGVRCTGELPPIRASDPVEGLTASITSLRLVANPLSAAVAAEEPSAAEESKSQLELALLDLERAIQESEKNGVPLLAAELIRKAPIFYEYFHKVIRSSCDISMTEFIRMNDLEIDKPAKKTSRPCRYGVGCYTEECPFEHPPREEVQEPGPGFGKKKLDRTQVLKWMEEGTFVPRIPCKFGKQCQYKDGRCTFFH